MNRNGDCLKTVKHDWCYKWTPLPDRFVHEGVKGPLTQPMLAIPFPCTFEDGADQCHCEELIKNRCCQRGIPDPWTEYVMVKKGVEKGCLNPNQFPKKDLKITRYLGENYRMDFGQGIPDPWKQNVVLKPGTNREVMKKDFRDYFENLKAEMFETDRICCPNCNRQLLVFCLNEFGRRRKKRQKEEAMHEVEIEKPPEETLLDENIEEKTTEEKLLLKDACIETDEVKEDVEVVDVCKCKAHKSCECPKVHSCECDTVRRVSKPKTCKCRKSDDSSDSVCTSNHGRHSCGRQRDVHTPICVHNFLSFLPRLPPANQAWGSNSNIPNEVPIPGRDQQLYQPAPYMVSKPIVPQFPTQPEPYTWLPPGLFACGDRNGHFLELKWVCQKCEKGKKKRRKGKHKQAESTRHECKPCLCSESKQNNPRPHSPCFSDDDDSDSCGIYKISRVRNGKPQHRRASERPRCHCDEGTSNSGNAATEGKPDRDFIQLLQMLGCTDLYRNKRNTDYSEPMVNLNMAEDPSEVVSTSGRVTHAHVSTPSYPNPNISHWKHPSVIRDVGPTPNMTHNEQENTFDISMPTRKTVTFQNRKPKPVQTTSYSNSTTDRLRKVNTVVRRRNKGLFKKEMNHFMSKWDTNWLDSDDSSSDMEKRNALGRGKRPNSSGIFITQDVGKPETYFKN